MRHRPWTGLPVGAALRGLRKSRGLSQAQLAKRVHVTAAAVHILEAGERGDPKLATIKRYASALGYPMWEVLRLADAMQHPAGIAVSQ